AWPGTSREPALPQFDTFNRQRRYIDLFNRGATPFQFHATVSAPWIALDRTRGSIEKERRLWVSVDWQKVPKGLSEGAVTIAGTGAEVTVRVEAFNPETPARASL